MTTLLSHEAFHESIGHAFDELLALEQISRLPMDGILRVLQSIPEPLLLRALAGLREPAAAVPPPAAEAPVPVPVQEDEQRSQPRRKVLRGGRIIDERRNSALEVQITEISDTGCRIRSREAAVLPPFFALRIVGIGGEKSCEVRWRNAGELGVRFLNG